MTLGTNIQQLRKEHNMSQGDLADALDISRQSVSKWETDTATPDLDKLLKLSEIFSVSLDELVKGADDTPPTLPDEQTKPSEQPEPVNTPSYTTAQEPIPVTIKTGLETRQIAGIILLCMTFLTVLVFTILGGFLSGLIFSLPFLVCGLICLIAKKHVGIYCGWAINIMLIVYLHLATGSSYAMVFNLWAYQFVNPIAILVGWIHLIGIVILMYCTVRSFRKVSVDWNKGKQTALILIWFVYVLLHFPYSRLFVDATWGILKSLVYMNIFLGIARMILLTALIIYTLNWYKWHEAQKQQ